MNDTQKTEDHLWLTIPSTKSEDVARQYDAWADKYNKDLEEWEYQTPAEAAEMLKIHLPESSKILDAGCGTGLTGNALMNAGFTDITGIDISKKSLSIAEQSGAYSRINQQDLQTQPFPYNESEFDAINCVGVLTYIKDPKPLFKEFCRIVRPGGYIVFTHREDLIDLYKYPEVLKELEKEGYWKNILTSEPKLYLPKNENFTNEIKVVFYVFQTNDNKS